MASDIFKHQAKPKSMLAAPDHEWCCLVVSQGCLQVLIYQAYEGGLCACACLINKLLGPAPAGR